MAQSYFPLRWESTGDQWWYASPIDWAAANGHYDLVRELLHLDINLLIKLTSLRQIRRLETLWDDDSRFIDAARCRASVARNLFQECETRNNKNTLIKAGYGGWLLYSAASAGDTVFVQELLKRDPLMVFGEGEYGLTDILYAAARGKNVGVFRVLMGFSLSPRGVSLTGGARGGGAEGSVFRWEVMNRAVHAAARGGNLEMLKELLEGCDDVLAYRDLQGSTILHAASGRGQVEVVNYLLSSFLIINSKDNQGNTALHVSAFRGHLLVLETLISFSPSSIQTTNNSGDTFLHMAVAGFRTPGFKRLDRQMELMKNLICGKIDIRPVINYRNNHGRTALHMAVIGNFNSELIELLMTVGSIDLNIRDTNGMTPLDLLKQQPRSPSSEILIKQLVSAGGISNSKDFVTRSVIALNLRMQGVGTSPGTAFKISDAEIFLYTGIGATEDNNNDDDNSGRPSSCSSASKGEVRCQTNGCLDKRPNSIDRAAKRIKILLSWPRHLKEKKSSNNNYSTPTKLRDNESLDSLKKLSQCQETPTPLRQRFSKPTSLINNKRTLAVRSNVPSPATKKKFAAGLMQGVIQAMPHLAPPSKSTNNGNKDKGIFFESEAGLDGASCSNSTVHGGGIIENGTGQKPGFAKNRVMNQYFCFGAQGLAVEDVVTGPRSNRMFKRSILSAA